MHTRTITITLTLDFGDDADLAYRSTDAELQEALAELLADNVSESLFENFAAGLQADGATLTIDTPNQEEAA